MLPKTSLVNKPMNINEADTISIPRPKGSLKIEFTDAKTGELVDVYEENNIVVNTCRDIIIK
jgi:hypothetical protein